MFWLKGLHLTKRQEKDVSEVIIPANDREKKKDSFDLLSVSMTVNKRGVMEILGDTEEVELENIALKKDASGQGVEFGKDQRQGSKARERFQ